MQENSDHAPRQLLFDYIDKNCLFRADPNVKYYPQLPHGKLLPSGPVKEGITWLFQLRRLTHNPQMLMMVGFNIAGAIVKSVMDGKEHRDVQLCGLETSSLPIIAATQMALMQAGIHVNAFTVRKERKSYGLSNYVEGIPNEFPCVFIDDLIGSGNSMSVCLDMVYYEFGLQPAKNAYCIVQTSDSENYIYHDWIIKMNTLFLWKEFDLSYNPDKAWIPPDSERHEIKRSEFV